MQQPRTPSLRPNRRLALTSISDHRRRLWGAAQARAPNNWEILMHLSLFTTFCPPIFWFAHPIFLTSYTPVIMAIDMMIVMAMTMTVTMALAIWSAAKDVFLLVSLNAKVKETTECRNYCVNQDRARTILRSYTQSSCLIGDALLVNLSRYLLESEKTTPANGASLIYSGICLILELRPESQKLLYRVPQEVVQSFQKVAIQSFQKVLYRLFTKLLNGYCIQNLQKVSI